MNDFTFALNDPPVLARNRVIKEPLNNGAGVKQPGNPVKLSAVESTSITPPAGLGQHTEQILSEYLELSPLLLQELRNSGIIA